MGRRQRKQCPGCFAWVVPSEHECEPLKDIRLRNARRKLRNWLNRKK